MTLMTNDTYDTFNVGTPEAWWYDEMKIKPYLFGGFKNFL